MAATLSLFPTEEQNNQQLVMVNNNRVVNEKTSFISCALEKNGVLLWCYNYIHRHRKRAKLFGMREDIASPIIRSYIPVMYVVVANLDYVEAFFLFNHLTLQPDENIRIIPGSGKKRAIGIG